MIVTGATSRLSCKSLRNVHVTPRIASKLLIAALHPAPRHIAANRLIFCEPARALAFRRGRHGSGSRNRRSYTHFDSSNAHLHSGFFRSRACPVAKGILSWRELAYFGWFMQLLHG